MRRKKIHQTKLSTECLNWKITQGAEVKIGYSHHAAKNSCSCLFIGYVHSHSTNVCSSRIKITSKFSFGNFIILYVYSNMLNALFYYFFKGHIQI